MKANKTINNFKIIQINFKEYEKIKIKKFEEDIRQNYKKIEF